MWLRETSLHCGNGTSRVGSARDCVRSLSDGDLKASLTKSLEVFARTLNPTLYSVNEGTLASICHNHTLN